MDNKEIVNLPAVSSVGDDILIPCYVPGATNPAQKVSGVQIKEAVKPVKGVDYFTEEDKAEIVQEVSAELDVGVKTINGNAPDEDGNIEISTDTSSTASTTAISVTEETDGSVTIVETLSDGSTNTAVITPDESGNPVTLTYNGTEIPITWTEASA